MIWHVRELLCFPHNSYTWVDYLERGMKITDARDVMLQYALLALRRRNAGAFLNRFSIRGIVRGAAVGIGFVNAVAGGWVYATADREGERRERKENPRWVD